VYRETTVATKKKEKKKLNFLSVLKKHSNEEGPLSSSLAASFQSSPKLLSNQMKPKSSKFGKKK